MTAIHTIAEIRTAQVLKNARKDLALIERLYESPRYQDSESQEVLAREHFNYQRKMELAERGLMHISEFLVTKGKYNYTQSHIAELRTEERPVDESLYEKLAGLYHKLNDLTQIIGVNPYVHTHDKAEIVSEFKELEF